MKEAKVRIQKMGVRFLKEGREWRLPGPFYADNLVFCENSEEELKVMVGLLLRCVEEEVRGRDWCVELIWMGLVCSKCQSSNIYGVFWMNQAQMMLNVVGR